MTFSVNVPSVDLVKETDFCGLVSVAKYDNIRICEVKVCYGKLHNAPLIDQCPINMESQAKHILNLGSHALIIGEIRETYISEDCVTDGNPDVNDIKPIIFTLPPNSHYRNFGDPIARAFNIGKGVKTED